MQVLHLPHLSPAGSYRLGARLLVAFGAMFWLIYGLAANVRIGPGVEGVAIPMAIPGIILALLLGVAWNWELVGGILMLGWALTAAVFFPLYFGELSPDAILFSSAALCLPPLFAGFLFIAAWGQKE